MDYPGGLFTGYTFIVACLPIRDIFPLSGFSPHMLCATLCMKRDSRKIQICYSMVGTMIGQGFSVSMIFSDGEGALGKLKTHLNMLGIELYISSAGGHVARIERKIQMIKERIRAHMTGRLPFTLTFLGIAMLILHCASRLNNQKSGVTGGFPREEFSGRRVDVNRDFRAAFGDYVVCTVPDTKNNMESRVTDGYVVLPTGNRTVYNITTQKIITRDQFIDCLNKQALAEGRRVKSNYMHVFDELLDSRKLSKSDSPTYLYTTADAG
jgi:hypothetical protein